tara:strand:- start:537 stop:701 length:165 start_codon:yes stop_codon:yes gene_type:complete
MIMPEITNRFGAKVTGFEQKYVRVTGFTASYGCLIAQMLISRSGLCNLQALSFC